MRAIEREIVAAIIFSSDGKILLGKKYADKGGVYVDCWHIPGGGIEKGESKKEAVIREVLEETGLDISGLDIQLVDDLGKGESSKVLESGEKVISKMNFYVFQIVLDRNSEEIVLHPTSDLESFIWTDKKDAGNLKLTPPSLELFKRLSFIK